MAATSNSLTSGEALGQRRAGSQLCLALARCWGCSPSPGKSAGANPAWGFAGVGWRCCWSGKLPADPTWPSALPVDVPWGACRWLGRGWPALGSPGDLRACPRCGHGQFGHPNLQLCPRKPYVRGVRWPRCILGAGAVAFVPLTNACVVVVGCFCSHADRRAHRASQHSPSAGDPAAGGSSCGRSGGRQRDWRPAGKSSTPCTHPATPRGTRRDALATFRRDVLLRHRGCQHLVWKPGANSTLKAVELLPADA